MNGRSVKIKIIRQHVIKDLDVDMINTAKNPNFVKDSRRNVQKDVLQIHVMKMKSVMLVAVFELKYIF